MSSSRQATSLSDVGQVVHRIEAELKKSQNALSLRPPTVDGTESITNTNASPGATHGCSDAGPHDNQLQKKKQSAMIIAPKTPESAMEFEFNRMADSRPSHLFKNKMINPNKDDADVRTYVRAQVEALRFSVSNGFAYHMNFDKKCAAVERSLREEKIMTTRDATADFKKKNVADLYQDNVYSRLSKALAHQEAETAVAHLPKKAKLSWVESQLEARRDLYATQEESRRNRRRTWEAFKRKRSSQQVRSSQAGAGGEEATGEDSLAVDPTEGGAPLLFGDVFSNEEEMMEAVMMQWSSIIAAVSRFVVLQDSLERFWGARRRADDEAFEKRLMGTGQKPALVALAVVRDKHRLCRKVLRRYVIGKLKEKHAPSVALILKFLRPLLRIRHIIASVKNFRRRVMRVQNQVRIFLAMRQARRMLLHLQWLEKECRLLMTPNEAVKDLKQRWASDLRWRRPAPPPALQQPQVAASRRISLSAKHHLVGNPKSSTGAEETSSASQPPLEPTDDGGAFDGARTGASAAVSNAFVAPVLTMCVNWVPHNGVSAEARTRHINKICTQLLRLYTDDLVSFDANRRFYIRQVSAYEAEGLSKLGLQAPRPPKRPALRLLLPDNAMIARVRQALAERPAGGESSLAGVTSFLKSPSGVQLPLGARNVSVMAPSSIDPTRRGTDSTSGVPAAGSQRQQSVLTSSSSVSAVPESASARTDSSGGGQQRFSVGRGDDPLSSGEPQQKMSVTPPKVPRVADSPKTGRKYSTAENIFVEIRESSSTFQQDPSSAANIQSEARRRISSTLELTKEKPLKNTIRSDLEYAKILQKPSIQAMKEFLNQKNTVGETEAGKSQYDDDQRHHRHHRVSSGKSPRRLDQSHEAGPAPMPGAMDAVACLPPSQHMTISCSMSDIARHHTNEALSSYENHYHAPYSTHATKLVPASPMVELTEDVGHRHHVVSGAEAPRLKKHAPPQRDINFEKKVLRLQPQHIQETTKQMIGQPGAKAGPPDQAMIPVLIMMAKSTETQRQLLLGLDKLQQFGAPQQPRSTSRASRTSSTGYEVGNGGGQFASVDILDAMLQDRTRHARIMQAKRDR